MTKQEAINVMSKYTETGVGIGKPVIEAHNMAIEALQKETRWAVVTERLPEKEGDYLIYGKARYYDSDEPEMIIRYFSKTFGFLSVADVIAWMPLPEVYKQEN